MVVFPFPAPRIRKPHLNLIFRKALDYYTQGLPLFEAIHEAYGVAQTLNSIGSIYDAGR